MSSVGTKGIERAQQAAVAEIIKCGKDPAYFIRTYCKIQHPVRGTIPFKMFPFQEDAVQNFLDHRFNIILKSRQLGITTVVAAYTVWLAVFYRDKNVVVIATKLKTAQGFIRKVRHILQNLPPFLRICTFDGNMQEIRLSNGSFIQASSSSENVGRSEALSLLIIDEGAHIARADAIWTSIQPTLSTGGSAIIMSTPNGVGGLFYDLYTAAEAKRNDFHPTKLAWDVHPERDQAWFETESRQLGQRKRVLQELLCQFVGSGDTYIQNEEMLWLGQTRNDPSVDPDNKDVWIWRHPKQGHKYVISADVSRGDSKDFSTFHIIDVNDMEVAAEYKGKLTPDRLGDLMDSYGRTYNNALACPEQNSFGYMTASRLKTLKYPNLFYMNAPKGRMSSYIPGPEEVPGFKTDMRTRAIALSKLESAFRRRSFRSYSSRLIEELDTFIWVGERAMAMRGKHDDLVMSLAIGLYVLDAVYGEGTVDCKGDVALLRAMSISSRPLKEAQESQTPSLTPPDPNQRPAILTPNYKRASDPIPELLDLRWLFR